MSGCCQSCKKTGEYKYWNELPSAKQSFFKVMANDFLSQMKIPEEFTECFKGKLAGWCTLRGPTGDEWRVHITRTQNKAFFSKGWDKFVRDHGLEFLDLCVFTYLGTCSFEVLMFKGTGSEREGAYFTANSSSSSSPLLCSSSLHTEHNLYEGTKQHQIQTFHISRRRPVTKAEKERVDKLATRYELGKANSGNPTIKITMLPTFVYQGFCVTINKTWALENMCLEDHDVKLKVAGVNRSWRVGCRWTKITSRCSFRGGWQVFVRENNLEEHDVCVFELVRKGNDRENIAAIFNVHIFRVVDQWVPFKVVRK